MGTNLVKIKLKLTYSNKFNPLFSIFEYLILLFFLKNIRCSGVGNGCLAHASFFSTLNVYPIQQNVCV